MKAAQMDKLYSKLTPHEQAALAFEALARQDTVELGTIVESVERHDYRCTHWDYRHRVTGFIDLANYYGLIYWKSRAYMEFVGNLHKEQPNDRHERLLSHFLDQVMAMDVALHEVCTKLAIDVMAVKKLALCDDEYSPDKCSDEGLASEYVGLFMGIVG